MSERSRCKVAMHNYAGYTRYRTVNAHDSRNADDVIGVK